VGRDGFTLLEMLVALVLFGIIIGGIYSIFNTSQNIQATGLDRSEAQQNARIGLDTVERELRLAGFGIERAVQVPILVASEYRVTFVRDTDSDGIVDPGETITYFIEPDTENFVSRTTPNPRDTVIRRVVSDGLNPNADPVSGYGDILAAAVTQQTDDDRSLDVPIFNYYDADGISLIDMNLDDPYDTYFGHTVPDSALGKPVGGSNDILLVTIGVTILCETEAKDEFSGDYDRVQISSMVTPRNFPLQLSLAKPNP
jgi:prepilin-type N-terminal cleavage/methylation domain-containing protein